MHLKIILDHKLAVIEIFFIEKTKTEAQSTKFKVTPDKTGIFLIYNWHKWPVFLQTYLKT